MEKTDVNYGEIVVEAATDILQDAAHHEEHADTDFEQGYVRGMRTAADYLQRRTEAELDRAKAERRRA